MWVKKKTIRKLAVFTLLLLVITITTLSVFATSPALSSGTDRQTLVPLSSRPRGNWDDMPNVDNSVLVHDLGRYFTDNQIEMLENFARAISQREGMPVVIVTTDDSLGRDAKSYAEDFFEANEFSPAEDKHGLIFVLCMDIRSIEMRTYGNAIRIFTDQNVDYVLDSAIEPLIDDSSDVYGSALEFLFRANEVFAAWDQYIADGNPEDYSLSNDIHIPSSNPDIPNGYIFNTGSLSLGQVLGIAFGGSGLLALILWRTHNKSVKKETAADQYANQSGIVFYNKKDFFINTSTRRTLRPSDSDSTGGGGGGTGFSGGSSTSSSSSGSSSGGGGRSF